MMEIGRGRIVLRRVLEWLRYPHTGTAALGVARGVFFSSTTTLCTSPETPVCCSGALSHVFSVDFRV